MAILSLPQVSRVVFPEKDGQLALSWPSCPPVSRVSDGLESRTPSVITGVVGLPRSGAVDQEGVRVEDSTEERQSKRRSNGRSLHAGSVREAVEKDVSVLDAAALENGFQTGTEPLGILQDGGDAEEATKVEGHGTKSLVDQVETEMPSAEPLRSDEPIALSSWIALPKVVQGVQPSCPKSGVSGVEQMVHFSVRIDSGGKVIKVDQIGDGFPPFVESAKRAVHRSRFAPGTINGVATAMLLPMDFDFAHCQ